MAKIGVEMIFSILILFELPPKLACFWINQQFTMFNKTLLYALVIARFRGQYGQYFFGYFTILYATEMKAKYEKRGKYWLYCAR